ncbi:MAG: UbiA family prenyltransferase [Gammaproteobacteria bacterium]|nr:UbiA family prenyltransferase [Gammaproteobacteria bacterium]
MEHAVSIFCLTLANSVVACAITARDFNSYNFCIAYTVCLLFFFRLRCFDEIKDYATDKLVNPARPLARGLISQGDVKRMFVLLTLAEMVLVSLLGASALLAHSIAVVYSYLMYKEFFIGKYLSPHLTTYALTHTFVSVLVAYSIFSQLTGTGVDRFTVELVVFGLASWAIFNLFEFARKTYAPLEERNNVATYTTTFGSVGAVVLSLSQIAASILVIVYLYRHNTIFDLTNIYYYLVAASVPVLSGILFLIRETPGSARLFRATCAVYLIAYYGLVAYQGFTSHNVFHSA